MQLKWTSLADKDLEDIEGHIAEDSGSPVIAIDVILKIIDAVEMILPDHPQAGRNGIVKSTRELVIEGVPYVVIYRIMNDLNQIQILRVMHDAQEWVTDSIVE